MTADPWLSVTASEAGRCTPQWAQATIGCVAAVAALMAQEMAYFAALSAANGYTLSGSELVITFGDQQELVFMTEDEGQPATTPVPAEQTTTTSSSSVGLGGTRWAKFGMIE